MAKAKPAPKAPVVNLFGKAKEKVAETPKKPKGTVFTLPRECDANGQLTGESLVLNTAVHEVLEASQEEKAAKNKGNLAKGRLSTYAQHELVQMTAKLGVLPPTPINIINHQGEAVTYVMQDKSQQNALNDEQVALLKDVLGEDGAAKAIHETTVFSFNSEVMEQLATDGEQTVMEVIAALLSEAVANCTLLTDEQKGSLIESKVGKHLRPNTLQRVAELCGGDTARIEQFLTAAGSSAVRYIKS